MKGCCRLTRLFQRSFSRFSSLDLDKTLDCCSPNDWIVAQIRGTKENVRWQIESKGREKRKNRTQWHRGRVEKNTVASSVETMSQPMNDVHRIDNDEEMNEWKHFFVDSSSWRKEKILPDFFPLHLCVRSIHRYCSRQWGKTIDRDLSFLFIWIWQDQKK